MAGEQGGSSWYFLNWSCGDGGSGGGGDKNGGFQNSVDGECTEVANKRIIDTPKQNHEQMKVADTLLKLRPFGLKLNLSLFPLDSVDNSNQAAESQSHPKFNDYSSQPISEKLKAANFEATFLKIGKWERRKKNEGDLIAKCYFAKKKLVWEFLEGNLKNKIEIPWNDIIGMKASIQDHEPGILEIELNQAPSFFEEIDPQPRKHTIWKITTDFTGGEASTHRRHYLVFPPGTLDKHYEKLLQCDQRLYGLNQKGFPSLKTQFFEPASTLCFSSDYRSNLPTTDLALQFNFASFPSPLMPTHPHSFKESPSPVSVMDFSHSDDQLATSSNVFNNRRAIWEAQGLNNHGNSLTPIPPFMDPLNEASVSYQNYNLPSSAYASNMLTNLEQHLFSNKPVGAYDENYHMARVPLNAMVNLSLSREEPFYGQEISSGYGSAFGGQFAVHSTQQAFYGQEMGSDSGLILGGNQQVQVYQQPVALPSLYPENSMMQKAWENLTYSPESFGQDNSNNEAHHWN